MIIEPKVRGFLCATAHPDGCREQVRRQIAYVKERGRMPGPKKVLVIGASTGYGLSARVAAAFGCGASTIGVMLERSASGKRTASAGWYNTAAFEEAAAGEGLYAKTVNGDAFSAEIKEEVIRLIHQDLGQVELVIYSVAAPRRTMADGTIFSSVLKTVGEPFAGKSLNLRNNTVEEALIAPAAPEEVEATIQVMGGSDWMDWIRALKEADVLAEDAGTLAFSYIGPEMTYPIYHDGTIGLAKRDLCGTAVRINHEIPGVQAWISMNKALVTQASAAIPMVPLYISLLYRVMKERGLHEDCIHQMDRLFRDKLQGNVQTDENGWIRLDDLELQEDIQAEVMRRWDLVDTENLQEYADLQGYWDDFYHMFGFHFDNVDYDRDVPME